MDRDEELRRRRGEHTRSYSQDQNPGYAQGGLVGRQDFGGVVGYILD